MTTTIYTLKQYQKEVVRLLGAHEREPSSYVLGLIGESGELTDLLKKVWGHGHELDREKLKKELGDCFWYVVAIGQQFSIDIHDIAPRRLRSRADLFPPQQKLLRLSSWVGGIARRCDLFWGGGRVAYPYEATRKTLQRQLGSVFMLLEDLGYDFGLQLSDVLQANVDKLRQRYPDGFSTEASVNRIDVNGAPKAPSVEEPPAKPVTLRPDDFLLFVL